MYFFGFCGLKKAFHMHLLQQVFSACILTPKGIKILTAFVQARHKVRINFPKIIFLQEFNPTVDIKKISAVPFS